MAHIEEGFGQYTVTVSSNSSKAYSSPAQKTRIHLEDYQTKVVMPNRKKTAPELALEDKRGS